jgi:hypothetical protein
MLTTKPFKLSPDDREQIGFLQRVGRANEMRILRNYNRRINNLIELERYHEAELDAARLVGILRAWSFRHEGEINACLKTGK